MTVIEQIYLSAAIAAFIFFGTSLFCIYLWTGMTSKTDKPSRKPIGILIITLTVSIVCAAAVGRMAQEAAAPKPPQLTAAR